jgi:A/G-specific adenine glycosylase
MPPFFAQRLLSWYAKHARPLPWRGTADAYRVWVVEVMLQQTQVETVIPYYQRWLARFPDIDTLAAASEHDVLAAWEGLGYYSRARNLHRAARLIVQQHGGRLPASEAALRALPGIGAYTAAAVASIAFGIDAAVLDGNVKRVLARVFDVRADVKSAAGEKRLWALARSLVPPGRAGDYNQALMDLGATICLPRAPACGRCPVRGLCLARKHGLQLERPVASPRAPIPHRHMAACVVRKRGRVLIERRPPGGLLGGLWAFPAVPWAPGQSPDGALAEAVLSNYGLDVVVLDSTPEVLEHAFTHFKLRLHVFDGQWRSGKLQRAAPGSQRQWVPVACLHAYPMGKLDRRIAMRLQASA